MSVRIPPDSEKSNLIRIEGDPQGVQQAKRELLELASRMVSPVAGPAGALLACPREWNRQVSPWATAMPGGGGGGLWRSAVENSALVKPWLP